MIQKINVLFILLFSIFLSSCSSGVGDIKISSFGDGDGSAKDSDIKIREGIRIKIGDFEEKNENNFLLPYTIENDYTNDIEGKLQVGGIDTYALSSLEKNVLVSGKREGSNEPIIQYDSFEINLKESAFETNNGVFNIDLPLSYCFEKKQISETMLCIDSISGEGCEGKVEIFEQGDFSIGFQNLGRGSDNSLTFNLIISGDLKSGQDEKLNSKCFEREDKIKKNIVEIENFEINVGDFSPSCTSNNNDGKLYLNKEGDSVKFFCETNLGNLGDSSHNLITNIKFDYILEGELREEVCIYNEAKNQNNC